MSVEFNSTIRSSVLSQLGQQQVDTQAPDARKALGEADMSAIMQKIGGFDALKSGVEIAQPGGGKEGAGAPPAGLGEKLNKMTSVSDIFQVMALFQQISQEARNAAREDRQATLDMRVQQMGEAAQKMRDAAMERLIGTCVQAGVQVASAAIQIGVSVGSLKATMKAENMNLQAKELQAGAAQAKAQNLPNMAKELGAASENMRNASMALNNKVQQAGMLCKNAGDIALSAGSIIKGGFDYGAANLDADKVEADKKAEIARLGYDRASDMMQQMRDIIRDIQSKLSEMDRSTSETNKQITRI